MSVEILKYTNKEPLTLMGEVAGYCWNSNTSNKEKNITRAIDCINNGHNRVSEFGDVYMVLKGYSARVIRELYTHIGGMPTRLQESTRYVKSNNFEFIKPPHFTKEQKEIYIKTMEEIMESYTQLVNAGVKTEDAANILPLGMLTKVALRINARCLIEMSHQRECNRTYWEFKDFLMKDIKKALSEYSPEWKIIIDNWFKPKCEYLGYCPEQKGCGYFK